MASQKVTTAESLILIESSDVHITTSSLCEGGFTKVTVDSLTLMDTSDVVMTITTGFEGSVTYTAAMYFLHFYKLILCTGFNNKN